MLSDKARAFLEERRFAVLGTINKDGTPQLSTMWYWLENDEIVMNTKAGRQKDLNVHRDPRVSVCFEDEYHYVTINGTAKIIDDPETTREDIYRLAVRYNGEETGRRQVEEQFGKEKRVTFRIKIERVFERF